MPIKVAVLFARKDSIYKTLPDCDVYDIDRDARNWIGGVPIVGHPPCRAWGGLAKWAKPRPDEKALAPWCVDQIREWGGVLEHPAKSKLWKFRDLPEPGQRDKWGGWTLAAPQFWWGHLANKATRFYIVGCEPKNIPAIPFCLGEAPRTMGRYRKRSRGKPELLKSDREKTPEALAHWLVNLAMRCKKPILTD